MKPSLSAVEEVSKFLDGSPYVLADSQVSVERMNVIHRKCGETSDIAKRSQDRIKDRAGKLFGEFSEVVRSEMVAESNKIEGYEWSTETVRTAADLNRELLSLPLRAFTDGVRGDPRVYEALGLYKAYQLAEEWAESGAVPSASEIRGFHSLIAVGEDFAGRYKTSENKIHGSSLQTAAPIDVVRQMQDLVSWWRESDAPPVLLAAVVHSWITQIHPFDDGNGRVARLIANMALAQHGYPPLLIKAGPDRGQYLDALMRSDEGDILPLYELFSSVIRRQVRLMARPQFVDEMIEQRLLSDLKARYELWISSIDKFQSEFSKACALKGWSVKFDGRPDISAFYLLIAGDPTGNSWFARWGPRNDPFAFLLWWGFESDEMMSVRGDSERLYPSIFLSTRFGDGQHAFSREHAKGIELVVQPLISRVSILDDDGYESSGCADGADKLAELGRDLHLRLSSGGH
ncbi:MULTISPECIES: Fic family protein [Stenotrophomonas]|uniref:Fic family protein n=1 Tax=Stenotrophomonas TaxID=40323 RepID=UPI000B623DE6|nr:MULTISPECIES: Fic family protein [Stenotrophomonas]SMR70481.1 Fic family protein [Stenotrophomonas sp. yr243]SNT51663.1 Fic family protein [Stenotrophomonas lactitubi]